MATGGDDASLPWGIDVCALAAAVPHGIWVLSASGAVEYANPHASDYLGGTSALGARVPWHSMVHSQDAEEVRRTTSSAWSGSESFELECRMRRRGRAVRWHNVHFAPAVDDDGGVSHWIATATDIDDGRALQETTSLLEAVEATAPVGVGFLDNGSRLTRINDTLAAMGSVPRSEQLGQPVQDVFSDIWSQIGPNYLQAQETATAVVGTVVIASSAKDSEVSRSWLAGWHPVRVQEQMTGIGLILIDVTECEQAQAFRSVIMDDMAEGLYTVDGDGKLTSMNRAASEMLGWQEKELLGASAHAVFHAPQRHGMPQSEDDSQLRGTLTAGLPEQTDNRTFLRRDGSTFEVACSVAPLETGGGPPGAVVTFRDMTEVRRAELEARHDQKLESLGRLSAGLAHEINTPIQFVGDNTRFLADAYRDMLELLLVYRECMAPAMGELQWSERTLRAQQAEAKADIEYLAAEIPAAVGQSLEGVERVASLVRAMKSFSYKDSSEQAYADLNEAIRTTLTVARNEVKYVADVVLDLGELPDVLCHLGDLNQVFLNLLVNAADALQDKADRGEIRITSTTAGANAVITFADNGTGIPEDIQQSIFEPFFTTKEVGKGTGQGLALTRAVLEKHAGSVEVRSVVGEGTEFILRLPIAGKQDAPA